MVLNGYRCTVSSLLVLLASPVFFSFLLAGGTELSAEISSMYRAREGKCDLFVSPEGSQANDGTSLDSPLESLTCTLNPECNPDIQSGDTVCLLKGTFNLDSTIMVKLPPGSTLTIMALGPDYTTILDGQETTGIMNILQVDVTFRGLVFQNGAGSSGAAVYGERGMEFEFCKFIGNTASIHAGAVMAGRKARFKHCEFYDNSAKFAGAVRVNDLGSAVFEDCLFVGNEASGRGGAVITQIETPDTQSVTLSRCLFCFNHSPMGAHIYNYRTTTHKCNKCYFNSPKCCFNHGHVVPAKKDGTDNIPDDVQREFMCACDQGWTGERCDTQVTEHNEL